jgi:hypothetical protein
VQGDVADGEHGERGENLRKRQSLLLRKERTHASRTYGMVMRPEGATVTVKVRPLGTSVTV